MHRRDDLSTSAADATVFVGSTALGAIVCTPTQWTPMIANGVRVGGWANPSNLRSGKIGRRKKGRSPYPLVFVREQEKNRVKRVWFRLFESLFCVRRNVGAALLPASAGDQYLGMLACNVEQAQRRTGRLPPPALPACGGHCRDIHHRGENRLADVELLAD